MSDVAIRAEGLSKQYRIGGPRAPYKTIRETMINAVATPVRRARAVIRGESALDAKDSIWALKDVSFEVKHGEVLGIIGRNGAGKTTLLKVISRITKPTEGHAEVRGRVGSLLEVGTGFHPELTGRENVYLNGAILGMRRQEIDRRFDEIVAFAEIEKFIDTPVKFYSSGMYVRLAFAVAAHLEPEILLVDEVLAVGDSAFQRKCLGKMSEIAGGGRCVMFVSHNLHAVSTLTKRTVVLSAGRVVFDGTTTSALSKYRGLWGTSENGEYVSPGKSNGVVRARVVTSEPNRVHRFGQPLTFEFDIVLSKQLGSGNFSFQIVEENAGPVVHLWIDDAEQRWCRAGRAKLSCFLRRPRIYMGHYSLTTHLGDRASLEKFETVDGICRFDVVMDGVAREYDWVPGTCTYLEDGRWTVG